MFGYVMANVKELTREEKTRYTAVYCGICRQIRQRASDTARLALRYDMAFLSLLLMSLYEPEEESGKRACALHPVKPRAWVDNEYIRYGADMNVALAYYKAKDDVEDENSPAARLLMQNFSRFMPRIRAEYPRQCEAMEQALERLRLLEQENCPNPDEPAGCFGQLMAELMVYREDMWAPTLRKLGLHLGRYIYLADAATDYRADKKKQRYNPFLAMGQKEDRALWEQYLVLDMGRCTDYFERLPLVQDKKILDNILYSGIWLEYRRKQKDRKGLREEEYDR